MNTIVCWTTASIRSWVFMRNTESAGVPRRATSANPGSVGAPFETPRVASTSASRFSTSGRPFRYARGSSKNGTGTRRGAPVPIVRT